MSNTLLVILSTVYFVICFLNWWCWFKSEYYINPSPFMILFVGCLFAQIPIFAIIFSCLHLINMVSVGEYYKPWFFKPVKLPKISWK